MKRILSILLIVPLISQSQIFSDHTDPFTGVRTVTTKPEKLIGNLVMITGIMSVDSTGKHYTISVWSQGYSDIAYSTSVPTDKGLWLIGSDNKKYFGKWTNTAIMDPTAILGKTAASIFQFTLAEFESLSGATITDVKMVGDKGHAYLMKLENNKQKVFKGICKALLEK